MTSTKNKCFRITDHNSAVLHLLEYILQTREQNQSAQVQNYDSRIMYAFGVRTAYERKKDTQYHYKAKTIIAFHKNILTLDNGGIIEIGDDENAKYRSTRVDGKGI